MNAVETTLDETRLRESLAGVSLFQHIVVLEAVGSTNDVLRDLATRGAPEGTVVLADRQTEGRGRLGRHWHSPGGLGLYVSTLLRPLAAASELTRWTLGAAVAACEACRTLSGAEVTIRWPNDLMCSGRKVGGVLAESRGSGSKTTDLVLGVGINVGHTRDDFPVELDPLATSLQLVGTAPERERLAAFYLRELEELHICLSERRWTAVARRWEHLAPESHGAPVRVVAPEGDGGDIDGTSAGLDETGALRVRRTDGTLVTVRQAETVLSREA